MNERRVVLVASAADDLRALVRMTLAGERFEVVEVADLDDAIFEVALTLPHVVVLDATLPGEERVLALARTLRAQADTAGIRTLLLAPRGTAPDPAAGIDAVVSLPVTPYTLLRRVEEITAD
jgi:DNA-binding response OmpR family regulator